MNLMLGGYDDIEEKPTLHHIDYMGADVRFLIKLIKNLYLKEYLPLTILWKKYNERFSCPYGAHGHGAMFTMSILDRHYNRWLIYYPKIFYFLKINADFFKKYI